MKALLRDKSDNTLIASEVEQAVYDPEDLSILIYSTSGTCYEVKEVVRVNADSMIKELAETGYCDFTQFKSLESEE